MFGPFPQVSSWDPWWCAGFPTRFVDLWWLPYPNPNGVFPTFEATSNFTLWPTPSSTSAPSSTLSSTTCPPGSSGKSSFRSYAAISPSNMWTSERCKTLLLNAPSGPCWWSHCVEVAQSGPPSRRRKPLPHLQPFRVTQEWLPTPRHLSAWLTSRTQLN